MSALSPRSGIQVSSVYPTYTHIKGQSPLCVCVCVCVCVYVLACINACVCVCVCVCVWPSKSQSSYAVMRQLLFFSFMVSFVFKQQVLFRVDFLSVTLDLRVQCPRVGLGVKI